MLDNQSTLPRLPVPSLENLKQKYLASCKPLLTEQEFEQTKQTVEQFLSEEGFGQELQKRLLEYDQKQPNSWLEDIWLKKAYLEWREPSLINVNWWCEFKDHPEHPENDLKRPPPRGVLSTFQIQRAAGLISNFVSVQQVINQKQLPAEFIKDKPLCMNQYTDIFGMTRIPGATADTVQNKFPTDSKHIIVMAKDQMYAVQVLADDGSRVTIKEIERLLLQVGQDSLASANEPPIGILTAGHRDNWGQAYAKLQALGNQENFDLINDALFVVCLDDHATKKNIDESHKQIFHNHDASNRWFDKAIQLIVANSGRAGVNGEHSPVDAVVPGNLFNHVLSNEPAVDPQGAKAVRLSAPKKLNWKIDASIEDHMKEARKTAIALIQDTDSCLLQTEIYGSRYIKEVASAPPDAFVQMALQLAYIRLHKTPTAIYESASTRFFKHGRTETGRSMSVESLEFCQSFDNDDILYDDKRKLLKTAIQTQSGYMKQAAMGQGIDRHMLGLRCMIQAGEQEKATMFTDPAYIKSMYFKLSTSNMSPGKWFYGGFGPVVPEGYGINYAIDKDALKFSISCKKSDPNSDVYKFREVFERTLKDLMILFPKRSEVWGIGWEKRFKQEKFEDKAIEQMKKLGKRED
ncbi:acyltransferase ChoActase/COT/CPT [Gorgonomyces haynaldii]|nr:acyltransferase ChoActase/COT/CPT [Gorgonomyces haynaldii]